MVVVEYGMVEWGMVGVGYGLGRIWYGMVGLGLCRGRLR